MAADFHRAANNACAKESRRSYRQLAQCYEWLARSVERLHPAPKAARRKNDPIGH